MRTKIYLNQIGYYSSGAKKACFIGKRYPVFYIIDADSQIVFTGTVGISIRDISSNDIVHQIDFSEFSINGVFRIKIGNIVSVPFTISNAPYSKLLHNAIEFYYFQRCGQSIKDNIYNKYSHGACHLNNALILNNICKSKDVSGGWHSGSAYSKYTITGCCAVAQLLHSFLINKDIEFDTPKDNKNLPHILDECLHELKWLLKMQDKDGGAFLKVCSKKYLTLDVKPDDDSDQQYLFNKSDRATFNLCAVMALASRIYEKYDLAYSQKFRTCALNCWAWILNSNHLGIDKFIEKNYISSTLNQNILGDLYWASCELYLLTSNEYFKKSMIISSQNVDITSFEQKNIGGLGSISYLLSDNRNDSIASYIKETILYTATKISGIIDNNGYHVNLYCNQHTTGSNLLIISKSRILALAYLISPHKEYIDYIQEQLDYIMGKNPVGRCFITGFGTNSVHHPFHRPSYYTDFDNPLPGMLISGADMDRNDECLRWIIPQGTPPAKCYFDDAKCFSCNAPALFCNSSLVFILSFMESYYRKDDKNDNRPKDT